jgi:hypothetical protein
MVRLSYCAGHAAAVVEHCRHGFRFVVQPQLVLLLLLLLLLCWRVLQIQRLMLSFPNTSHGYQYILFSIVSSVLLGLLIYGIPVWTM